MLRIPGYSLVRLDRCKVRSGKSRGGGILVWIESACSFVTVHTLNYDLEHVTLKLDYGAPLLLSVAYLPPVTSLSPVIFESSLDSFCCSLEDSAARYPECAVLIVGDFNLPRFMWSACDGVLSSDALASRIIRDSASRLESCTSSLKCAQLIRSSNCSGNTLDLAFCSIPASLCTALDPLAPSDRHHEPVIINLNCVAVASPSSLPFDTSASFNFKKANYSSINAALASTNWNDLLDGHEWDVDMALDCFYRKLFEIISCNVPLSGPFTARFPSWMSVELRAAISQKKIAHRIFKASGDGQALHDFRNFRIICKRLTLRDYNRFICDVEESLESDPGEFWRFANPKDCGSGYPDSMYYNSIDAHDGPDIVNLFAERFPSVFSSTSLLNGFEGLTFDSNTLSDISLDIEEVIQGLAGLKPSSAAGSDGIPSTFFVNCSNCLAQPIMSIMNLSLRSGTFPTAWKQAFIIPVYKRRGDRRNDSGTITQKESAETPMRIERYLSKKVMEICN
ncbi:uncharacterized protein LOC131675288 [Phymastichus coffea]|uniref:uncharacterized protein LOC131675288 n=1 Tax=Phymastichus coffea TaxID=108790 RepID=UPI00273C7A4C|nr:uncharacterized protein LOC131675288 [Phymastichus coffea]